MMTQTKFPNNWHGILLVNKPQGLSSNGVLQRVKRLLGVKKAGHTGSLDPLATGMLPICLGEATKVCQYLLDADKCYEVTGCFGIKTDTGDAMGTVIERAPDFICTDADIKKVLTQFEGAISQVPPMYSALKHKGVPLYKFARKGVDITRKARDVFIRNIEFHQWDEGHLSLTVTCSKGTYIRSLIEDIAEQLGSFAHVTRLHRSYTAGFAGEPMYSLDDLASKTPIELKACLLPMERSVLHFPTMILDSAAISRLRQGMTVNDSTGDAVGCVRLYEQDGVFVGLGDRNETGELKVKRLLTEAACQGL